MTNGESQMTNQVRMSKGRMRGARALRHSSFVIDSSCRFRHSTFDVRHSTFRRDALSLLEVILAIAILGGALAIIGELIRIGARNAAIARDLTTAQLYCESKMSEAAAGVIDLENLETEQLDEEGEWMCVITTEALDQQQLIAVKVTVGQNPDLFARPVSFSMTRWIVDPSYVAQCAALDAQLKAEAKQRVANAAQSAGGSGLLAPRPKT